MFPRFLSKQNKLKRFLLKIFNVYAYDKETLNIVNPNYKNDGKNIINFNDKSFNYSLGYLNLTRKITSLDIFFRYSPNNNLWNSTDRWKRIIPNIDKKTLISVCLLSLKESLIYFLKNNNISITLNLIADNSNNDFDNTIVNLLKSEKIKIIKHDSKIKGNRGSFLECCDQAEKANDLIFFIEDDYLFEENCINEMIFSYSRFGSILNNDIFLCPSDYPFYYDSLYNTNVLMGNDYRWRTVGETLLTFLFSKTIFNENKKKIRNVGDQINEPFEKPLHEIYNNINCLAPIGSLSYHVSRHVPSVNENWKNVWNKYYKKYKGNI